ncbi:MAG: porphobilinogen synthase [Chlamydiales bacterium]|nr:porphobilinogen synthase [Chlamydiales bacterium]
MLKRPRRNRKSQAIRSLVQETQLNADDFVAPLFVTDGPTQAIKSMPGILRYNCSELIKHAEHLIGLGIKAIALFPCIDPCNKDELGSYASRPDGLIPKTIRLLKEYLPDLCIIADVALDPYTTHGHDGLLQGADVHNDLSVEALAKQALVLAQSGADIIAPSDMMDGRVLAIRKILDLHGFEQVSICSYAAKYASSYYAPFRSALGSKLVASDKKSYQLNPANRKEALLEGQLDVDEGADMLMVKPALSYLDIISDFKATFQLPICAFHVSGEYAMVMAAHNAGILDADRVFFESLLAIKRAGASFIFTYAAERLLENKRLERVINTAQCSVAAHL